jgi:hypothetical protein
MVLKVMLLMLLLSLIEDCHRYPLLQTGWLLVQYVTWKCAESLFFCLLDPLDLLDNMNLLSQCVLLQLLYLSHQLIVNLLKGPLVNHDRRLLLHLNCTLASYHHRLLVLMRRTIVLLGLIGGLLRRM